MSHVKWPEIEGFHNVRKAVKAYGDNVGETSIAHQGPIIYRPKIKLHGTNAGITLKNNGKDVFAQSRTSIIGTGNDNMGFAAWVEENRDFFKMAPLGEVTTIFGEWCGPGIQKGVAVNQIPTKIFAIFAVQVDDRVFVDPVEISYLVSDIHEEIVILPWGWSADTFKSATTKIGTRLSIDWTDQESMEFAVNYINPIIDDIDKADPWVKEIFKVDGPGEGLVWYPISLEGTNGSIDRDNLSNYLFKTKGEKHQAVKTKQAAQLDPEVAASIDSFVELVLAEARLEQGAREINRGELEFSNKLIGPFIGWVGKDVSKECKAELEASGLEWKQVVKAVQTSSRKWYLQKIEEI